MYSFSFVAFFPTRYFVSEGFNEEHPSFFKDKHLFLNWCLFKLHANVFRRVTNPRAKLKTREAEALQKIQAQQLEEGWHKNPSSTHLDLNFKPEAIKLGTSRRLSSKSESKDPPRSLTSPTLQRPANTIILSSDSRTREYRNKILSVPSSKRLFSALHQPEKKTRSPSPQCSKRVG